MDITLILDQIEKELNTPIFEVSRTRLPVLKDIDKLFGRIRELPIHSPERAVLMGLLADNISKFTKIKYVYISHKLNYMNATIAPRYKRTVPELFTKEIKFEDANEYIKSIYLIIGDDLFKKLEPRELTAVLLHELGHLFQHTTLMNSVAIRAIKFLSLATSIQYSIVSIIAAGTATLSVTPIALAMATFALSRSLTFKEHMEELDADNYAAKYGYGDELTKVFYMFNKISKKIPDKRPNSWSSRSLSFIKKLFNVTSHPNEVDRICSLINKMKKDYIKQYPKLSKEISTIYADIRC